MKTGISAAIRRFLEQHIVADDPYPERSWLDLQDMPCEQTQSPVAVAGLPVEPLPSLPQRFGHGRDRRGLRRIMGRHSIPTNRHDGGPAVGNGWR
ncbi:hypothetical protein [Arthrobacter sp. ZGTC131]|uniref:hypothetical protein n=1 Tax=Arthrobacter sp. ZGTC131 TaxID=2058898 RepID=UPI0011B06486|nr:hypothetical protein [Arthrobacter sp. ZGTC131]